MVKNHVFNDTSQIYDYITNYYEKKYNINFVLTNEEKFTSPFYWIRVHQLLTNSPSNNDSKYIICQVKEGNSLSKYIESDTTTEETKTYIKNYDSVTLYQYMDLLVLLYIIHLT